MSVSFVSIFVCSTRAAFYHEIIWFLQNLKYSTKDAAFGLFGLAGPYLHLVLLSHKSDIQSQLFTRSHLARVTSRGGTPIAQGSSSSLEPLAMPS